VFAALDRKLFAELTLRAFHLQHNLLGRLGLYSHTEMDGIKYTYLFSHLQKSRDVELMTLTQGLENLGLHTLTQKELGLRLQA